MANKMRITVLERDISAPLASLSRFIKVAYGDATQVELLRSARAPRKRQVDSHDV